ncbi:hypothetical protein VT84_16695 [Gemmata sp. SH-PL17]|uniref:DUF4282 domain-containing protein n=1 Tax=Gemmata sp. SH-PL17 TaxID=1630693 RepID=UPI0004B83AB2|nr:DUF4282 domain-containing protein [Gemmata sp. SH-PL17]AMV26040.1 hypothetical protein VT84_16695 [Gemmata sp. SH-PL17]
MKNACPKCGTAYNVSASVIGRKFTCKNCGTPVVVTDEGLDYQNAPAKAPPPSAPAPVAASGGAFDFDAAEEDERKSSRGAKAPRPSKERFRDDEDDARDVKKKRKYEDDEEDDLPVRKPRRTGGGKSVLKDFLFFKEFVAPLFVKLTFFLIALILVGIGLVASLYGLVTGKIELIFGGILYLLIAVPFYLLLTRIYCEIILLGFAMYDRLGEIKTLLEKSHPPTP